MRHWNVVGGATQTVRHTQELVNAHATHCKGSVLPGLLVHLDLPEPTLQVHTRKVSGTHHALHGFLHTRQRIGILFGLGIQVTKSMQNHSDSPFFLTSTMALHNGDWEGWMVPPSSIS